MPATWKHGLLALAALWGAGDSLTADASEKPIVTSKKRFRIPFKTDAASLQRMIARELQLHVSLDQGASWQLAQTAAPAAGKFEFEARADGEYWFMVKTIDASGRQHPPGNDGPPGLVVIVDATPPVLELRLTESATGKVTLAWDASDPQLDVGTLRLEYKQPGMADWEAVSVLPRASGQTAWTVPDAGMVSVRGSIFDMASNTGRGEAELRVAGSPEPSPTPPARTQRVPVATDSAEIKTSPRTTSVPSQPIKTSAVSSYEETPVQSASQGESMDGFVEAPRLATNRSTAEGGAAEAAVPGRRYVRMRRFQLDYQIADVGSSGLGAVELFVTQDGGRKWWYYDRDADQQSPFDVVTPEDGEYGFQVRARSGAGLSIDPPVDGDRPETTVIVDTRAPRIELSPILQGQGRNSNQLMIRWQSQDEHAAKRCVTLSYAATPHGPWTSFAEGIENTGSHVWTVGDGLPAQAYFRVQVRDAAGNVGQMIYPQPIVLDVSRPSARITDVVSPDAPGLQ